MIDLRRLRVLRAVAHYGTITAAAEALHFTTSAASQQLRQLGRDLDVVLLEPQGRRVRLTPAARRLLAHADAIETRWEQAEIDLRAGGEEPAGTLRCLRIPTAVAMLLAPIVAPLRDRYPRLTVRIQEAEQEQGFNMLFDGDTDLAILDASTTNPPAGDPRFDQRPLVDDVFDLAVAAGHPFAARESVTLAETARRGLDPPGALLHLPRTHAVRLRHGRLHPQRRPQRVGLERGREPGRTQPRRRARATPGPPAHAPAGGPGAAHRPPHPQPQAADLHPRRRPRHPAIAAALTELTNLACPTDTTRVSNTRPAVTGREFNKRTDQR